MKLCKIGVMDNHRKDIISRLQKALIFHEKTDC